MSSNWKYSSIPATERLKMLQDGDKDLYDEEIARTKQVIKDREELGLDTSAQMKWLDDVSYNYNISNAENMGISSDRVNKTGYANKMYGGSAPESIPVSSDYRTNLTEKNQNSLAKSIELYLKQDAVNRKNNLLQQYKIYVDDINKTYDNYKKKASSDYENSLSNIKEALFNSGASLSGGKTLTEELKLKENLANVLSSYENARQSAISAANNKLTESYLDIDNSLAQNLSNEFYKYNALLQNYYDTDYQKERDAISDAKWLSEFNLEKDSINKSYQKWLSEFNEDVRQANLADSKWKTQLEYQKERDEIEDNMAEREFELKASDLFQNYKETLSLMSNQLIYDEKTKKYVPMYKKQELIDYINRLNLTDTQKKQLAISIGIIPRTEEDKYDYGQ